MELLLLAGLAGGAPANPGGRKHAQPYPFQTTPQFIGFSKLSPMFCEMYPSCFLHGVLGNSPLVVVCVLTIWTTFTVVCSRGFGDVNKKAVT